MANEALQVPSATGFAACRAITTLSGFLVSIETAAP